MIILLLAALLQASWISIITTNQYGYAFAVKDRTLIVMYPNGTTLTHRYPFPITSICFDENPILGTYGGYWKDTRFVKIGEGWVTACSRNLVALSKCCPPFSKIGDLTINDTVIGITQNYVLTWRGKILSLNGTVLKSLKGYILSYDACSNLLAISTCCPDRIYVLRLPSLKMISTIDAFATKVQLVYCKYLAYASRTSGVKLLSLDGKVLWSTDVDTYSFSIWADKLFAGLYSLKTLDVDYPPLKCLAARTYANVMDKVIQKSSVGNAILLSQELSRWLSTFISKLARFEKLVYSKPSFTYILDVNYASLLLRDMIKDLDDYMSLLKGICETCYKLSKPYYIGLKRSAEMCISHLQHYARDKWHAIEKRLSLEIPKVKVILSTNSTCIGSEVIVGLIIHNPPTNPPLVCNVNNMTFSIQPGLNATTTILVKVEHEGVNEYKYFLHCTFLNKHLEELVTFRVIGKKCR